MARFVGFFTNKIDAKGRVSVPADFRSALAQQPFSGVVCSPSFVAAAIDGGGVDMLEDAEKMIDAFDPYEEEKDAFAVALISEARKLSFDADGRILLPSDFIEHAGLSNQATFAGMGSRFRIWEPEAFEAERARARQIAMAKRSRLKAGGVA